MKAILLAAGKGERLKEITQKIPKPMLKIKGEVILEHNIKWLKEQGIRNVYINLHYLSEAIKNYFRDGKKLGVKIYYSYEPIILGTAGGVKKIVSSWRRKETFMVIYGDNFYHLAYNLKDMIKFHFNKKGIATVGLYRKKSEAKKSGVVMVDRNNLITNFTEKPSWKDRIKGDLINTGLYILEPKILNYVPDGYSDFGKDIFQRLLKNKLPVYGFLFKDSLVAIDTPELYKKTIKL